MSDLVVWLLAQIDADEQAARGSVADGGEWFCRHPEQPDLHMYGEFGWVVSGPGVETEDSEWGKSVADHIARHDPARVLAECKAKRAIVAEHPRTEPYDHYCRRCLNSQDDTGYPDEWVQATYPCPTLRALAQVYAGNEGWREEWAS